MPLLVRPLPQVGGDGLPVGLDRLAFLVVDPVAEPIAQHPQRLPQVRLAFARHQKSAPRIGVGIGMGIGVGQLALADAAQAVHAADHAGVIVLQPRPQFEQLVQSAGESLVVRRDRVRTLGGPADPFGPLVQVACDVGQHTPEIVPAERGHALLIERLDRVVLPPSQLFHDRRRRLDKRLLRRGHAAQLGRPAGHLVFFQDAAANQTGHFHDVDRRGPEGQDMLGDLGVDPCSPLAAAPLTGQVIRRDEGEEQP